MPQQAAERQDPDFPPHGEDSSCDVFPSYEERPRPPRIPVELALAVWMPLAIGAWWLADPLPGWFGGAVRSLDRRRRGPWRWQAGRSRMCSFVLALDFCGRGRLMIKSVVEKASEH